MAVLFENFYLDVFAIVVSLLTIAVGFFKWSFTFWKRKGVYTLHPSIPFGNAADLVFQKESLGTELKKNYSEFKKKGLRYGGFYFFNKPIFIPVDLDLVKAMLTTDFAHFADRMFYTNSEQEPLTGHIIFLKGLRWKQIRTKLDSSFTPGKIKMMFQIVLDCTKELRKLIDQAAKKRETVDIREYISRYLIDVIGSCAFGIECNSLNNPNAEFAKYGKKFFNPSTWSSFVRMLSIMSPELLNYVKFRTVDKDITDFFENVVKETVNYRERNKIVRNDMLELMMRLRNNLKINDLDKNETGGGSLATDNSETYNNMPENTFTLNDIAAQCFGFFVAGFETATNTIGYCLYELANNSKMQEKLRKEINTVLERHEGKITYDSMMQMTYLDKCVNESLRMYPPVPMFTRECTKTYRVPDSDVVIEKGTFAFIPILGIQRDPEIYSDPEKFDPERFSEEEKNSRHPTSYIPFGDGPRICIGLRLGEMQVKIGLIALLKDYRFTLNPKTPSPLGVDPKTLFVTSPKGKILLDIEEAA